MTGNDFSTECVYRIHSLLLELIDYSCNVELGKQLKEARRILPTLFRGILFCFLICANWTLKTHSRRYHNLSFVALEHSGIFSQHKLWCVTVQMTTKPSHPAFISIKQTQMFETSPKVDNELKSKAFALFLFSSS